jgi:hypothetical protein
MKPKHILALVIALTLVAAAASTARAQPVPPTWRPPVVGCTTGQVLKFNSGLASKYECGSVSSFSTLNAIPVGDGTGMVASGLTDDGTSFDVNRDVSKFGASGDGYVYIAGSQINFMFGSNADDTGYINHGGYNNGTTQFRNLQIGDGKYAQVAFFDGSDKSFYLAGFAGIGVAPVSGRQLYIRDTDGDAYIGFDAGGVSNQAFFRFNDTGQYLALSVGGATDNDCTLTHPGTFNCSAITVGGVSVATTSNIAGTSGYIPQFTGANTIGDSLIQKNGTGAYQIVPESNLASFAVGANGTTATDNAFLLLAYNTDDNYFDTKVRNNGGTYFRTGHNTESGGTRNWMIVGGSDGAVVFPNSVSLGDDKNVDQHTINGHTKIYQSQGSHGVWAQQDNAGRTTNDLVTVLGQTLGTMDSTAAVRNSYAGYFENQTTRSAGANDVINNGIFVDSNGGQQNYAIRTYRGINLFNEGSGYSTFFGEIHIATATATDNGSPGIMSVDNDDFLYDGKYLNHYGFGFYVNSTTGPSTHPYISGYAGVHMFASGALVASIGTTVDFNSDLVKFGTTDGYSYVNANTWNGYYSADVDGSQLWVNYAGYNNGFTRFRDFVIGNGKGAAGCAFTGSTSVLNCIGGLQVNGTNVATTSNISIASNVIPKGTGSGITAGSLNDDGATVYGAVGLWGRWSAISGVAIAGGASIVSTTSADTGFDFALDGGGTGDIAWRNKLGGTGRLRGYIGSGTSAGNSTQFMNVTGAGAIEFPNAVTLGNASTDTHNTFGQILINGTDTISYFNYSTNEDVYIRAGKSTGKIVIGDVSQGGVDIGCCGGTTRVATGMSVAGSMVATNARMTFSYDGVNTGYIRTNAAAGSNMIFQTSTAGGVNQSVLTLGFDATATFNGNITAAAGIISGHTLTATNAFNASGVSTFNNGPIGINNYAGTHLEWSEEFINTFQTTTTSASGIYVNDNYHAIVTGAGALVGHSAGIAGRPGVATLATGSTSGGAVELVTADTGFISMLGGKWYYAGSFYLPNLSGTGDGQNFIFRFGMINSGGCMFVYNPADATFTTNWGGQCLNGSGGVTSLSFNGAGGTVSSPVAAATWYRLELRMTSTTNAEFWINGTLRGTITTNIPTAAGVYYRPYIGMTKTLGTSSRSALVDQTTLKADLNSARSP